MDDSVHVGGVVAFASLPGDAYTYRVDYEQSEGRAWLWSSKTEREWECVIDNRDAFEADAVVREQFNVEMELLGLSLHPRFMESDTCKQVTLTRSGDDLVMQLSPKIRDPREPVDPEKPKVSRIAQRKEILARFREENKALKGEKRECISEMRRLKTENDTLRRENQLLRESVGSRAPTALPKQQSTRSELENLRRENHQLKQARDGQHAHLLRIGGAHEFQRQHIEHLRRTIAALQQQVTQFGGQPAQQPLQQQLLQQQSAPTTNDAQEVVVVDDPGDQLEEHHQSKRRRTSEG